MPNIFISYRREDAPAHAVNPNCCCVGGHWGE